MANQKNPYEISSIQMILKDLRQQVKEHRVKFSTGKILALLVSILLCFILFGTQFNMSLPEAMLIWVLLAAAAGLILYLIRKMR